MATITTTNNKKYEIVPNSAIETFDGHIVHKIRALRNIPKYRVRKYSYGGYIEDYKNLEQEGNCWVGGNAKVYGRSSVQDNAIVKGKAIVRDSFITNNAIVQDTAIIEDSTICSKAIIKDHAKIKYSSMIFDNAIIQDTAHLESCYITDNVIIKDDCSLVKCEINDNVIIRNDTNIEGVKIQGDAIINNNNDYVSISNFWTKDIYNIYNNSYSSIVYTKSNNKYCYGNNFINLSESEVLEWLIENDKDNIEIKAFKEIFKFIKRMYKIGKL